MAMAKIQVPIFFGSTPMRRAPSGFSAAAVIAWPSQVRSRPELEQPVMATASRQAYSCAPDRDRAEGEGLVEVGRGGGGRVRPPDQGDDGPATRATANVTTIVSPWSWRCTRSTMNR